MIFLLAACLVAVNAFLVRQIVTKRFSKIDSFVRLVAVNFLVLFIAHHVDMQFEAYRLRPGRFTVFSWINWGQVMVLFALFLVSYLVRLPAKVPARSARDVVIPLLCAAIPFVIAELPMVWRQGWLPHSFRDILRPFYVQQPSQWNALSIVFLLAGNLLVVWALWHLRRSFSILAEARAPVFAGPYRFFRHPMYLGEILAVIGIVCLSPSVATIFLATAFVVLMVMRTKIEERKLSQTFDDYATYRGRTVGFLPRPKDG